MSGIELYPGEHAWPGILGNASLIVMFCSAILGTIAYLLAWKNKHHDPSWFKIARAAFITHAFSVFVVIGTLMAILINHYMEYQYAWQHTSLDMPMKYIFASFWEGQEGSFLLWMFWHAVLGLIMLKAAGSDEAVVMAVFCSVQVFLASMVLGIHVLGYKFGSNPFLLLREHPEFKDLPFTKVKDYLKGLDGRGLNPLLRNYWMTIHPPTLFLGFASTLIPFSYAIAAMIKRDVSGWIKPALPWAFFGIMILGTGVLMGGAWAYESLSFGGFWAWDPVENSSLVPWIILVAAAHMMLLARARKKSYGMALCLAAASFLLVLYSTFLTRSGILGDTSVHAFTDLGMSGQLLVYLLFYVLLALVLLFINRKALSEKASDEHLSSREFWMLIGALILIVSSFQITFSTSLPVINKLFGTNLAPPSKPIEHYNSWQIPLTVFILLLMAVTQFMKYRQTDTRSFAKTLLPSFILSLILCIATGILLEINLIFHWILLFAGIFATLANLHFSLKLNGGNKWLKSGASIAHAGFALLIVGALISAGKSKVISQNTSGFDITNLGKEFNNLENIMLLKHDTLKMGDYHLTYSGRRVDGVNHYFKIDYLEKNQAGYNYLFTLEPLVQTNPRMGNTAEPDTRHYLHKDIYTHVTYADLSLLSNPKSEDFKRINDFMLAAGDTFFTATAMVIFEGLNKFPDTTGMQLKAGDLAVAAQLSISDLRGKKETVMPVMCIRENRIQPVDAFDREKIIRFSFTGLDPETGKITLKTFERENGGRDFIVLKAVIFPWINLLWSGCILMVIGTILAILNRLRLNRTNR